VTTYEVLRARHQAAMLAAIPEFVARLAWTRQEIEIQRRRALRLLLRVAVEYSPWHRERLRGIDPGRATEADLASIPPMTRDDLMDHWDEIAIQPEVSLERARAHLRDLEDDAYLQGGFHAVESSGAGGRPGVFLYDWDAWIAGFAGCARWRLRNRGQALEKARVVVAAVTSQRATHVNQALIQTFAPGPYHHLAARLPLREIASRLEAVQPDVLVGYPSVLHELAVEAQRGELAIRPAHVSCTGEPLRGETREVLAACWNAPIHDSWAASESVALGQSCSDGGGMHVNDDLVILEPVDDAGRPAPPGTPSRKTYLTNLFNLALPLIRYELDDSVTLAERPCPCGSSYTLVDHVQVCREAHFVYADGRAVETARVESALLGQRDVLGYQVRQTPEGAEVLLSSQAPLHLRAVGHRVASALARAGVPSPWVSVRRVERIARGPTGKVQRFVPRSSLAGGDAQSQGGAA
jgi:phenylacetate-coenzyme A ligase PaaK-like adenylate-forming protein